MPDPISSSASQTAYLYFRAALPDTLVTRDPTFAAYEVSVLTC